MALLLRRLRRNREDKEEDNKEEALFNAIEKDDTAVARELLDKGVNTEAQNEHGKTPLIEAASENREAIVKLLLDRGANIEANLNGATTLATAVNWCHGERIVRLTQVVD
jgi:ankyrin repeat protein